MNRQHISVLQRTLLCWCERKETDEKGEIHKTPRILVCHISNPHGKHEDDMIYPTNFSQIYAGNRALPQRGERIHFHGLDRSDYFFLSDAIFWIEAAAGGKHSVLHTATGETEVTAAVSSIEKLYPHLFLRCHQSYLVNPHYLRNIRRFEVTLTDGTVLPVPEKKYTAFRDAAKRALKH
ncbi:MAG: LytTR family transcriptional regulator [Clostridia bacterium]|nr:LytTR family transcriptional regulator [Clostridia bacterium]